METYVISGEELRGFARWLREEERGEGSVEKYLRDVGKLAHWLDGAAVSREQVARWKGELLEEGYAPATINSMLAAVHQFFRYKGWESFRVRYLKLQHRAFREGRRELTRQDYEALLRTARDRGQDRLALLLETMASTGVRVSEVRYITADAARQGYAEIALKGKLRRILLPGKLCRKLLKYAKKEKIAHGEIFLTRSGKTWGRKQIWAALKALAHQAGVEPSRVFPHNLRHLFAVTFYRVSRDLAKLADVLGHTSIETTRLYLISTGREHARLLDRLRLVT